MSKKTVLQYLFIESTACCWHVVSLGYLQGNKGKGNPLQRKTVARYYHNCPPKTLCTSCRIHQQISALVPHPPRSATILKAPATQSHPLPQYKTCSDCPQKDGRWHLCHINPHLRTLTQPMAHCIVNSVELWLICFIPDWLGVLCSLQWPK